MDRAKGGSRKAVLSPLGRRGVTALEFAIVAPTFILLLFAAMGFGLVLYSRSTLQLAVEQAARCAAVDKTQCGNAQAIQTYAAGRVPVINVPASSFTATTAACGQKVSASWVLTLPLPPPLSSSFTVTASSCHPI